MMAASAKHFGFFVIILDPTPRCPASGVADRQIVANFDDCSAIHSLASVSDVITYEFEHIDSACLLDLEKEGYSIHPTPWILSVIQNKLTQKETLSKAGISVPSYMSVTDIDSIKQASKLFGYPLLLKSCCGGYDGKGNLLIESSEDLDKASLFVQNGEMMIERFIPFSCEVSVVVARDISGNVKSYSVSENEHFRNILRRTIVPARIPIEIADRAKFVAETVVNIFSGVGIFCVEMFVTKSGEVLVNEIAPRPHNSGHYTIEACVTSQFEQHVRAITGLPLGDTTLRSPVVMINLLGEEGEVGPAVLEGCSSALSLPGVHLHFYGKEITAPLRKMGHITVTAPNLEQAIKIADIAYRHLRVVAAKGEDID